MNPLLVRGANPGRLAASKPYTAGPRKATASWQRLNHSFATAFKVLARPYADR